MRKITLLLTFLYSSFSFGQYLSEGFESGTSLPASWILTQTNTTETWEISTTIANNGTNSATVAYDLSTQDETLISPSIDLTSATNPRIKFWWNMSYYWSIDPYNYYDFTVSIDDGTNVTELFKEADVGIFTNFTWYEQTIDLSDYVGLNDVKILFNYSGADGASLNLDDILVEETPTCFSVTDLTATTNSTSEVEISWTAGGAETEWTYEYGPTGFTQGSGTITITGPNNPIILGGLTSEAAYDIYVQANCGGTDGNSTWSTLSWTMPIAGDTFATATTLPFIISAEGTGCTTSNISIDFPNSGFTASGLLGNGTPGNEGIDAFFNWTATTDALRYWGAGAGSPYIGIHDASGTEIAYSTYNQEDIVLSGWAVGDELVIRIYDYGTANILVDFCLEYYTLPAAPNCAENVSPTGSDVSFNDAAVSLSWDAPSSGPSPTGYEVFWGTTSGDLTSLGVIDAPVTAANITGMLYGETYYYSVVPSNGAASSIGCTEYSLTVENASAPFNTDFTNYPAGFSESTGPFGTPSATVTVSNWGTADFLNDATLGKGAKVNIYGTLVDEYLISPTFDLSSGTHYLNIDAGITDWDDTVTDAAGMDAGDDYVAIVLSEDDGASWSELYRWDSTSGLTNASLAMPEITLSSTSTTAKIALYAFSAASGGDYDFHITNLQITTATLGIATNTLEGFTLYPTIVKEELNFRSQNKVAAITVFNLLGQKVFSGAPNANNSSVNLSNLRPGVYIVKVKSENSIGSYKIIKE